MYYPIQIPHTLSKSFSQNVKYAETSAETCNGFAICFWEMQPLTDANVSIENVIVADACIDIVVDFDAKEICFAGMSQTEFHFILKLPNRSFGVRMMPGAFHQLTGLPATDAMEVLLPVEKVFSDFDKDYFFSLNFEQAKEYFENYLALKFENLKPNLYTTLFNMLFENIPLNAHSLYEYLNLKPRNCQRLFKKHYGISPKTALSILRFQKCLQILTSENAKPADILNVTNYYDQPHFIKDFKRNIGITPLELIRVYKN